MIHNNVSSHISSLSVALWTNVGGPRTGKTQQPDNLFELALTLDRHYSLYFERFLQYIAICKWLIGPFSLSSESLNLDFFAVPQIMTVPKEKGIGLSSICVDCSTNVK